jgi:hypothetical protein
MFNGDFGIVMRLETVTRIGLAPNASKTVQKTFHKYLEAKRTVAGNCLPDKQQIFL